MGGTSAAPFDTFNLAAAVGDDPDAVRANRARLARELGIRPDRLVWMKQVHGTAVERVTTPQDQPVPDTDALVTATPGLALAALVADCVPILLADADAGVVGAVHAGRRGAAAGVALHALDAMVALGADPGKIDVLLGPAVCGRCYEVPADMRAEVDAALPGSACDTAQGAPGLDLRAGLGAQLGRAGVATVVSDPRCTAEDPDLFSYRRDGRTGRQAGVVWISDQP